MRMSPQTQAAIRLDHSIKLLTAIPPDRLSVLLLRNGMTIVNQVMIHMSKEEVLDLDNYVTRARVILFHDDLATEGKSARPIKPFKIKHVVSHGRV